MNIGPVAGLVGIEGGVVSEVINLESSGVGALNRMIGSSASERAFHVSQLLFTLRHTRPPCPCRWRQQTER